jgi:hypothetical protein
MHALKATGIANGYHARDGSPRLRMAGIQSGQHIKFGGGGCNNLYAPLLARAICFKPDALTDDGRQVPNVDLPSSDGEIVHDLH